MTARPEAVQSFVIRYFQLLGAAVQEVDDGLFRIELDRRLAAELEGDTMPPWMWMSGPAQPTQITYYFTFFPDVAERHPEAELVSPGSHRLQQVIESVRQIAEGTRAHLPFLDSHFSPKDREAAGLGELEEATGYRPFYIFCLRVEFHGVRPLSRLFCVAVDLVDLIPLRQLGELFSRLRLLPDAPRPLGPSDPRVSTSPRSRPGVRTPSPRIEAPRADLDTAFRIAYQEVLETLGATDPSWAEETWALIQEERRRLSTYFTDCEHEGIDVVEEQERRLAELDRMRPRVFVRLQGVCEAYLPVRYVDGRVEYLALSPGRAHAPGALWPTPSFK